jgi:uncharacterized protein (TIGR01777 family)
MARIVVPGGTGYLGRALTAELTARGDDVVVLSRGGDNEPGGGTGDVPGAGVRTVHWDAETLGDWVAEVDGADAVVHLNGRRVDVRSTRRNIDELISSRVQSVRVMGEAVARCRRPPPVWVQSSSLAVYGDTGDTVLDERSTPSGLGPRQMVTVCLAWEAAYAQASVGVPRGVLLRMGIGLGGAGDPATAKLAQLVRWGLGGRVGSGRQWVSWIGLDDLVRIFLRAIDDAAMSGTYCATGPRPVTNAEMMRTYRRLLGRRFGVPAPAAVTQLGAPLLGSNGDLALTGRRVLPTRLLEEGFAFEQADFEAAAKVALERCGLA